MSRRSLLLTFGVLIAGLVGLPTGAADPTPPAPALPAAVGSEHLLFAHLKAKDIRDSALFNEIKQAFTKAGGTAEWDKAEELLTRDIALGIKPTEIDSVTLCITEQSKRHEPIALVIVTSSKPVPKTAFGLKPDAKPDNRGFRALDPDTLVHFPDDKTLVLLDASLAQKYLEGYAKNRTGWPFTAELSKAASAHTLFAVARPDRFPARARFRDARELGPLFAARTAVLTADLKGKELSVAGRATFADATAAGKAKHKVHTVLGFLCDGLDELLADRTVTDLRAVVPVFKEAERALASAKVEVVGSDLTLAATYTADLKVEPFAADVVKYLRDMLPRRTARNSLQKLAFSLHGYAATHDDAIPVHGIGAKGLPLANAKEKPLLSWRVAMLPHIEQESLYQQFKLDEPWDSENNKKLIEKMPKVFASITKPAKPGYTHLQMVVGPPAMGFSANLRTTFTDGTSNTIAIVEAAEPVIWTKPDDVMFPKKELPPNFRKRFGGQFPNGFFVALWDGSTRFVPDGVTDRTLSHALTPSGGEMLGDDW